MSTFCSICQQPIPADAPAGQCPACLLAMAREQLEQTPDPASWPPFEPANRQFGDYLLGRQLGSGGMGVVYEAVRTGQDQRVAIKLIRDDYGASPQLLCRFTIEAEAVARLEHPNIVRIFEAGEHHGHPFFSMELVDGESLAARVRNHSYPLDWDAARGNPAEFSRRLRAIAQLMATTARAVNHAHQRGVLHRDLKPGNILIDAQGEPHLMDFGLAKILQPTMEEHSPMLTTPGVLPGTPSYMAPEQVSGHESTTASDIYALGAMLYELLTGRPPFTGHTPLETFKHIAENPPTRPRALNANVDANLQTICLKCLEKDPRQRYGSAAAMAQDLENWLAGRPIVARAPSVAHRVRRWVRRNPLGAALIGSLCLGLLGSLVLLKLVNEERDQMALQCDQAFQDAIDKIGDIWKDPDRKYVDVTAWEMAIFAETHPARLAEPRYECRFGVSTEASPSSIAREYALLLRPLQKAMEKHLGQPVVFSLRLFKRFNQDDLSLARREADVMVLSACDFLRAESMAPGVQAVARDKLVREAVLFAHTNSGIRSLSQLVDKSVAFPDPDLSITVWAKARLAAAGVSQAKLRSCINIVDQGSETNEAVLSLVETVNLVLTRKADASVTFLDRFERYSYLGLRLLDSFPETPNILAARDGLDPRVVQALRKSVHVLQGRPGFDSLSLDVGREMVPVEGTYFQPLQQALRDAKRF